MRGFRKLLRRFRLAPVTPSPTYNFTIGIEGPTAANRGKAMQLYATSAITVGTRNYAFYTVTVAAAPNMAGIAQNYPTMEQFCCGANKAYSPQDVKVRLNVDVAAALGARTATLEIRSNNVVDGIDVVKTINFPITVRDPAAVTGGPPGSPPVVPSIAGWESVMLTYANAFKAQVSAFGTEAQAWYYDGGRCYFLIKDYTVDAQWEAGAQNIISAYRNYVSSNGGAIPGYRVFPHGLYMDWVRNGVQASKDALHLLATGSPYASAAQANGGYPTCAVSRETAYALNSYRLDKLAGNGTHGGYQHAVDMACGHLDQWAVARTQHYVQPFMVALTMEALIQEFETNVADTRIPELIKASCDFLWDKAWVPADASFWYENTSDGGGTFPAAAGAPDLNLLIAPAFAWLYKRTADATYQTRGDAIWNGGVADTFIGQGKQGSQKFRWGFDYIKWRTNLNAVSP